MGRVFPFFGFCGLKLKKILSGIFSSLETGAVGHVTTGTKKIKEPDFKTVNTVDQSQNPQKRFKIKNRKSWDSAEFSPEKRALTFKFFKDAHCQRYYLHVSSQPNKISIEKKILDMTFFKKRSNFL